MISYQPKFRLLGSIIFLLATAIWIWFSRIPGDFLPPDSITAPQVGFKSPDFSLVTLSGSDFNLNDFAGKPLVINFWASWCPPCRAEMPAFQEAFQEYSDTDLVFAAINATHQDSLQDVEEFIKNHALTFLIPLDKNGSVSRNYNVHSLPTTFFVDRQGLITKILIGGPLPLPLIRTEINQLLEK